MSFSFVRFFFWLFSHLILIPVMSTYVWPNGEHCIWKTAEAIDNVTASRKKLLFCQKFIVGGSSSWLSQGPRGNTGEGSLFLVCPYSEGLGLLGTQMKALSSKVLSSFDCSSTVKLLVCFWASLLHSTWHLGFSASCLTQCRNQHTPWKENLWRRWGSPHLMLAPQF